MSLRLCSLSVPTMSLGHGVEKRHSIDIDQPLRPVVSAFYRLTQPFSVFCEAAGLTCRVCNLCRKLDENEVDDQLRETIRNICQQLVSAINKYYAFGSVFVDEAT